MVDPQKDVKPAANVPAAAPISQPIVPPVPAQKAQPTPAAVVGDSSKDVKTDSMVPLPALQEERSKRQQLESEVADLRRMVQNQYNVAPQQQQAHTDPKKELEELWDQDPRKAVQVEIMYAMDWRDRIDSSLEGQADQLASKHADFNNYRSSTLGYVRTLPLNQRSTPGILEAAYYMVRGQNADTLLQQRETELLEKYRRGEISAQQLQAPVGMYSAPAPTGLTSLTPDQHTVAEMMGLSDEGYASQIKINTPGNPQ